MPDPKHLYTELYEGSKYAGVISSARKEHFYHDILAGLIERFGLKDKKCLEIGCGRGTFQNMVVDYTGVDIAGTCAKYLSKPFFCSAAEKLPFNEDIFDCVWSIAVLEHLECPETALREMLRVLKPGGVLFLHAAWFCRWWRTEKWYYKPFGDSTIREKIWKVIAILGESLPVRGFYILLSRPLILAGYLLKKRPELIFKKFREEQAEYFGIDSDATNSLDPYSVINWFLRQNAECLSHPGRISQFFSKHETLVFRKNGTG